MKKSKKNKKDIVCKLRNQADHKNKSDCESILNSLDEASNNGEYGRTIQLKVNQAHYMETLGLNVESVAGRSGYYEISWKNEK